MDSRQLRYFISVAMEGSIIKAANYLPLTPSAIAKNIIALEEEIGVVLFERRAKGILLTPAGEVWFQHARQLLSEMEQANNDVRRASQGLLFGCLDVGIPASNLIGLTALDEILAIFSARNPNVEIVVHKMILRQQQIDALRRGTILAAFNTHFPEASDLVVETFAKENVWLATSINHPLANDSVVSFEKLNQCSFIGFQESNPFHSSYEIAFKIHGVTPRVEYTSSDIFSHLGMCACSNRVTLLSPVLQALKFPGVKFTPLLSDFSPVVRYECARLKRQSSPLLQELIKSMHAYNDQRIFKQAKL